MKRNVKINVVDIKPGDKAIVRDGMHVTVRRKEKNIEPWRLQGGIADPDEVDVRDPKLLRAIGLAKTDLDRVLNAPAHGMDIRMISPARRRLREAVTAARFAGESWSSIARVLGESDLATETTYGDKGRVFSEKTLKEADEALSVLKDHLNEKPKTPYKKGDKVTLQHRFHGMVLKDAVIAKVERGLGDYLSLTLYGIDAWFNIQGSTADWKVVKHEPAPVYPDGMLALVTSNSGNQYLSFRGGNGWDARQRIGDGQAGLWTITDDAAAKVELLDWYRADALKGERVEEIINAVAAALGRGSSFQPGGATNATVVRAVRETIKIFQTGLLPDKPEDCK